MKHRLLVFTLAILTCMGLGHAQALEELDNAHLLKHLDDVVAHKLDYRKAYLTRIDSMKRCAASQPLPMRGETYRKIYKAYLPLQSDSALSYLSRMECLPQAATDRDFADVIRIGRAHALGVMGLYSSAAKLLRETDVSDNNTETVLYYFQTCRAVYGWMADFGEMSGKEGYYQQLTQNYRDSILSVQPQNINRLIIEADNAYANGDMRRVISICKEQYASADELQRCYLAFNMAQACEALGQTDDKIKYLALAAISDLHRGITEYSALLKLAVALSDEGDTERAYKYLICTLEDASYGKARLRSFEASEVFPIIEKAYEQHVATQRNRAILLTLLLAFVLLLLAGGLAYSRRRNRQLALVRTELAEANESLRCVNEALVSANKSLRESNRAKETCLARYLERCRVYIDTLDNQRKGSLRLLKAHKLEELNAELRSSSFITTEEENFYADFDEAFLSIFPDFISNFNALLQPDAQIVPKREEMLNTELRIFALIRLGIADSNRIAHFLNYSLPTIYSYRSRIRNKSIYAREEFDARIMEC